MAEADRTVLVDPGISTAKLDRELADWHANRNVYRRRGWWLIDRDGLTVEVAFARTVPFGQGPLTVVPVAVRFNFDNYDLLPPSVEFIDPVTGASALPRADAIDYQVEPPNNALVGGHPATGRPFLCLPGIREYHTHPTHSGDDWLLYRSRGDGRLAVICERIHARMVATVQGVGAQISVMVSLQQGPAEAAPHGG